MRPPKHLWAGDWQRESAAAATSAPLQRPVDVAPQDSPPPTPTEPDVPRRRLLSGAQARRAALAIGVAALVLAGGAYALTSLHGSRAPAGTGPTAWLGVRLDSQSSQVVIVGVAPGSPAEAAGLRPGDVITQVEGRPVVSPLDVTEAVDALGPGAILQLEFQRGASVYTTGAKLVSRSAGSSSP